MKLFVFLVIASTQFFGSESMVINKPLYTLLNTNKLTDDAMINNKLNTNMNTNMWDLFNTDMLNFDIWNMNKEYVVNDLDVPDIIDLLVYAYNNNGIDGWTIQDFVTFLHDNSKYESFHSFINTFTSVMNHLVNNNLNTVDMTNKMSNVWSDLMVKGLTDVDIINNANNFINKLLIDMNLDGYPLVFDTTVDLNQLNTLITAIQNINLNTKTTNKSNYVAADLANMYLGNGVVGVVGSGTLGKNMVKHMVDDIIDNDTVNIDNLMVV